MSTRTMRLRHSFKEAYLEPKIVGDGPATLDLELPPRSLYILAGPFRYNYTHEILSGHMDEDKTSGLAVSNLKPDAKLNIDAYMNFPFRRISIIIRDTAPVSLTSLC